MQAGSKGKSYDDINVTPMVDLYLVLLLIFIIMTTVGVQGLKVHLPKSSNAPSLVKKHTHPSPSPSRTMARFCSIPHPFR